VKISKRGQEHDPRRTRSLPLKEPHYSGSQGSCEETGLEGQEADEEKRGPQTPSRFCEIAGFSKKGRKSQSAARDRENGLPQSYGSDRLVLLSVNPNLVYVYWDLSSETLSKLSAQKEVLLRLYDVTYIVFDGTNAHRIFEAGVHLSMTRNYYFHVPMANADYLAELGFKAEGKFVPVLRSNVARTPSNTPSTSVRQRWIIKGKRTVKIGEPPLKPVERIHISSQVESGR